tara:strand:- start:53 stop:811 length:759 start_codon:yes stop_codon:yes gene_type:complete
MNATEVNKLCEAMIKFNMIPSKRVSQKDKDFYSNMRRSLKNNKQTKTDMILRLCMSLINDSNQINDETSEHSKEFTDIYNCYEADSVEDLVVRLHQINRESEENRSKVCEEKYKEKIEYETVISMKNEEILKLNSRVRELTVKNQTLEKRNSDLIDKYDSDSEEEIETNYYDDCHLPVVKAQQEAEDEDDSEIDWSKLKLDDGQPISPPSIAKEVEDEEEQKCAKWLQNLERENEEKVNKKRAYMDAKYGQR